MKHSDHHQVTLDTMYASPPPSGEQAPSVALQSAKCVQSMSVLLAGAASAIRSITRLKLTVTRGDPTAPAVDYTYLLPEACPAVPSIPPHIHLVPRTALSLLAASVPNLRHLHMCTSYGDVDLAAFGSHCPQLSHLTLECDAASLQGIDISLPSLTHLCLTTRSQSWRRGMRFIIRDYIDTALLLLRGCTSLVSLDLSFPRTCSDRVDCPSEMWDRLPASLVEWHCRTNVPHMREAKLFMGRVRVLSLGKLDDEDGCSVQQLLTLAPLLHQLTVSERNPTRYECELMWDSDITAAELDALRTRLQGGFTLSCEKVSLMGTAEAVQDMLAWLSPLEDTISCRVFLTGMARPLDCLGKLARMCPCIEYLYLGDEYYRWQQAPWTVEAFVTAVTGCKSVRRLDVDLQVLFTHAWLVSLCVAMPALHTLYCRPCAGVSCEDVMMELENQGHEISIVEISEGVEIPEAFQY